MSGAQPIVKVALHNLSDAQRMLEPIRKAASRVFADFPDTLTCRMEIERVDGRFEAHLEVVLPERQLILNGTDDSAAEALGRAVAATAGFARGIARAA